MASDALKKIDRIQKDHLREKYRELASNKFLESVKSNLLFQQDGSELLAAAPLALATLTSCCIAAADPMAEKISLKESQPTGDFKYLAGPSRINRWDDSPLLRSCLWQVAQMGGVRAFTTAGANMDYIRERSNTIVMDMLEKAFQRLRDVTQSRAHLEDFHGILLNLRDYTRQCVRSATEIREAFTKWALMCSELQSSCEPQTTSTVKREAAKIDAEMETIRQKSAFEAKDDALKPVTFAKDQFDMAEMRLDKALRSVLPAWESKLQEIVTSTSQATLSLLSNARDKNSSADGESDISDPAYSAAVAVRPFATAFYDYLGGEAGQPLWDKFTGTGHWSSRTEGIEWLLGELKDQKSKTGVRNTSSNRQFLAAIDLLIKVGTTIKDYIAGQPGYWDHTIEESQLASWKRDVNKSRKDILFLVTVASSGGSNHVPNVFFKEDQSAQVGQVNTAVENARIDQAAAEAAVRNYGYATMNQSKAAWTATAVQNKLKNLHDVGRTLERIKWILTSTVAATADIVLEVSKIERLLKTLEQTVNVTLLPKFAEFPEKRDYFDNPALKDRGITADNILKHSTYVTLLQMKGYFLLLEEIATMYKRFHVKYVEQGMQLYQRLNRDISNAYVDKKQTAMLQEYSENTFNAIKEMVTQKRNETHDKLEARASKSMQQLGLIFRAVVDAGLPVDRGYEDAIMEGGSAIQAEAQKLLAAAGKPNVEKIDLNYNRHEEDRDKKDTAGSVPEKSATIVVTPKPDIEVDSNGRIMYYE